MAILDTQDLVKIRQAVQRENLPIDYTKFQLNAAVQRLEDKFEASRGAILAALDPNSLHTLAQNKAFFKAWFDSKNERLRGE